MSKAPEGTLAALMQKAGLAPDADLLRAPEVGSVMVQGRTDGTGAPFHLGEMTVTRCSVRLPCGTVGHGYVQGRRKACARAAALGDAVMQTHAAPAMRTHVLEPLAQSQQAKAQARATKAAATKVEFFTLVRGED